VYTPGVNVRPPRSVPVRFAVVESNASELYPLSASAYACSAVESLLYVTPPMTVPGGKPVIDVPEYKPKLPLRMRSPVLVTVEAPKTAKLLAVPMTFNSSAFMMVGRKDRTAKVNPAALRFVMIWSLSHATAHGWPYAEIMGTVTTQRKHLERFRTALLQISSQH
jgi:hypothetical protein